MYKTIFNFVVFIWKNEQNIIFCLFLKRIFPIFLKKRTFAIFVEYKYINKSNKKY
jgi:hypothetical protein